MKLKSMILVLLISIAFPTYAVCADTRKSPAYEGDAYFQTGRIGQAIRSWEKSLSESKPGKNIPVYLETVSKLGRAYQILGHHRKALAVYKHAEKYGEIDSSEAALFYAGYGDLYLSMGNMKESSACLEKAEKIAAKAVSPLVLATIFNNKGNIFFFQKSYSDAEKSYRQSLNLLEKISPTDKQVSSLMSKVIINIARLKAFASEEDSRNQDMLPAVNNAFQYIRSLPDSYDKAADMISLTTILNPPFVRTTSAKTLRHKDFAVQILNEAGRIGEAIHDARIISYTNGYLGLWHEYESQYDKALQCTRKAIFYAQQGNLPEILYLWEWQLGRIFKHEGETKRAIAAYRLSIDTLTPIRKELMTEYRSRKDTFYSSIRPVYLGLAELLLSGESTPKTLKEATDTMEILKTAELQDFFMDECVGARQEKIALTDESMPNTAVIYPIAFSESLSLLLTLPNGMKHIRMPVESETLGNVIRQFRRELQDRTSYDYKSHAVQLYNWIIKPIEEILETEKIHTLIFAPDGLLRLIPFSAFYDGNRFLIEKYEVVTVPAITLTDLKPMESSNMVILANGLSEARQDFPPLPNVKKELESIRSIGDTQILLDREYTVRNMAQEYKQREYPVLHMATHGVFGNSAKNSFLLTYDDKLTMDGLEKLIEIGGLRENQIELLSLSACQTAMGDERAALGLAGVAIKAGARSAIATLWLVSDEAAYMLFSEFYRNIRKTSESKAKALRKAQLTVLAEKRFRHPMYWSPFLLIGNWM